MALPQEVQEAQNEQNRAWVAVNGSNFEIAWPKWCEARDRYIKLMRKYGLPLALDD